MRISCIQMDMAFADPQKNFPRAEELVRQAARTEAPDVVVLPETWNVGFFPNHLSGCADEGGKRTRAAFSALARELNLNIVAGSVATHREDGRYYNTAYVFNRAGECVAEYDKIHAFTPMGEDEVFAQGDHLCRFTLDGQACGLIICYDIRFPELTRSLALQGMDLLFVVSQWPEKRIAHLDILSRARAIENQMFLALCNSCGCTGNTQSGAHTSVKTQYGGHSAIINPWGEVLAQAGSGEEIITADASFSVLAGIRSSINVFRDRKPALYRCDQ